MLAQRVKLDGAFNHNINIKRASEDAVPTRYVVETNSNPKIRRVYPSREACEQARAAFERSITPYPLPPEPWRAGSYDAGDAALAADMDEAEDDEAETDAEWVTPQRKFGFEWLSPSSAGSAADSPAIPIGASTASTAARMRSNTAPWPR